MDELFKKTVSVRLKASDKDERQVAIGVTILLTTVSSPVLRKKLVIRLTDEKDPFFLFTLTLGDDDFQGLKMQQGLLVDFSLFPRKLIDLLEQCLSETGKENPRFLLQFFPSPTNQTPSLLHVVETNPFRHLHHLSLKFVLASDEQLKKYLAESLLQLKEENARLSGHLASTKSSLSGRLAECEEALCTRTLELERLKSDWSSYTATLTSEHSSSLNSERARALDTQATAQVGFEQEKKNMELAHQAKVCSLEGQLQELDGANKELTDLRYKLEASIRELNVKHKTTEEECGSTRNELQKLRKENSGLDAGSHEQDKTLTQLRTRLAVLEQELQDKEQMICRFSDLVEVAKEQKKKCKAELEHKAERMSKLEYSYKSVSREFLKGKEVIKKLIMEMHNIRSKLKAKNVVTVQQENLLGEKGLKLQYLEQELETVKRSLSLKEEELSRNETVIGETRAKLEHTKEQLQTSENVVSWLNKRENDLMLDHGNLRVPSGVHVPSPGGPAAGSSGLPASTPLSCIRPTGTGGMIVSPSSLVPHYPPITSYTSMQPHSKFNSTPFITTKDSTSSQQHQLHYDRHVLSSLGSKENIAKQHIVFKGGKKYVPSPLSEHALVAGDMAISGGTPHSEKSTTTPGEPWLDPKYLPPEPPSINYNDRQQTTGNPNATVTSKVLQTQATNATSAVNSGGGRLQGRMPVVTKPNTGMGLMPTNSSGGVRPSGGGPRHTGGSRRPTVLTSSYFPRPS